MCLDDIVYWFEKQSEERLAKEIAILDERIRNMERGIASQKQRNLFWEGYRREQEKKIGDEIHKEKRFAETY